MIPEAPIYREDSCSEREVLAHLEACDEQFRPPLSARVELARYAGKIRARARTFEAWQGEVLAGLVAAYFDPAARSAYVTSVSVLPQFGRRGIARRLMEACLAHATRAGTTKVSLEVAAASPGAVSLYAQLGFEESGRSGENLFMTLTLKPAGSEREGTRW
ncbi:MAG TPA: GNAT family N-acetyltransferase [Anaeromyxobacteraceae bacterium]|nr:GNAT family N-acetyltransferase [Anaeromyxobacteraceae bacterium]